MSFKQRVYSAAASFLLLLSSTSLAQQKAGTEYLQEEELRVCLAAEKEGMQRFAQLEERAKELHGTQNLLTERRQALEADLSKMNADKTSKEEATEFNSTISVFNQQTDQLNADKTKFEQDQDDYNSWRNNTLKPACETAHVKPAFRITVFYACGYDKNQEFAEVPYCKSLENLDEVKACAQQAGSKTKAYEACLNQ